MSGLLSEEKSIRMSKTLASEIGLLESIIYSVIADPKRDLILVQDLIKKMSFVDKRTVTRKLSKLVEIGYVKEKVLTPEEKKSFLQQNKTSNTSFGNEECEWCASTTLILQEHHYPIPRCEGGTDVVKICPNCHYEFHSLNKAYYIN